MNTQGQEPKPKPTGLVSVADAVAEATSKLGKTGSPLAATSPPPPAQPPPGQAPEPDEVEALLKDEAKLKAVDKPKLRETLEKLKRRAEEAEKARQSAEEQLRARLAEATKPAEQEKLAERIRQLEEEREQNQAELRRLTLAASDEFGGYYKREREKLLALAKQRLPETHHELFAAISHVPPGPARRKLEASLFEDLDEASATDARLLLIEMDKQRLDIDRALAADKENFEKLQSLRAEREAKEREMAAAQAEAAARQLADYAAKAFRAFQPDPGDPQHTEKVKKNQEKLRQFLRGELDPTEMAMMPLKAAEFDELAEAYVKLKAENDELQKAVAATKAGAPRTSGTPPKTPPAKGTGFVETVLGGGGT